MKTPAAKRFLASRFDFVREKKAYSGNLQPSLGEKEKKEDKEREETKPRTSLGEKETKKEKERKGSGPFLLLSFSLLWFGLA